MQQQLRRAPHAEQLSGQSHARWGVCVLLAVKSAGCENRMAQLSLIHSCQCMGPWVVSALKSARSRLQS